MAEDLNYDPGDVSSMGDYAWSGCFFEEDKYCSKYGRLYTWEVVMDNAGCAYGEECGLSGVVQGICPEGWHVPTNGEFSTLYNNIGGSGNAGKMLKSASGWEKSGNGTDEYGFSVLPAGGKYLDGDFLAEVWYAFLWSASEFNRDEAWYQQFHCKYDYAIQDSDNK